MQIILRADSGFYRDELLSWCQANAVDYVFGLAHNERPSLSALAYVLIEGLRGTEWVRAQAPTIRSRLLKIGARIQITTGTVWIWSASSYPPQRTFAHTWGQLRC